MTRTIGLSHRAGRNSASLVVRPRNEYGILLRKVQLVRHTSLFRNRAKSADTHTNNRGGYEQLRIYRSRLFTVGSWERGGVVSRRLTRTLRKSNRKGRKSHSSRCTFHRLCFALHRHLSCNSYHLLQGLHRMSPTGRTCRCRANRNPSSCHRSRHTCHRSRPLGRMSTSPGSRSHASMGKTATIRAF